MKALVLIAHGSRRKASNEEIITLSRQISKELNHEFPIIEAGFLELAEPLIPDAISSCVQQGATEVCIVPYFLSAGRHVQEDVPYEVEKSRQMHNHVSITIIPHIGGSPQMINLIRESVMTELNANLNP